MGRRGARKGCKHSGPSKVVIGDSLLRAYDDQKFENFYFKYEPGATLQPQGKHFQRFIDENLDYSHWQLCLVWIGRNDLSNQPRRSCRTLNPVEYSEKICEFLLNFIEKNQFCRFVLVSPPNGKDIDENLREKCFEELKKRVSRNRKIKKRVYGWEWLERCMLSSGGIHVMRDDPLINNIFQRYNDLNLKGKF